MKREIPVEKNKYYNIHIEDLNTDGDGVGKIEGYTLFVPFAIPGDYINIKVLKTNKHLGFGKIEEIITPSKDRTIPKCNIFNKCGGCQLQHIKYNSQLAFKRKKVEEALKRIGGFEGIKVEETIGMENPYFYRNKAQYPVGIDKNGELQIGFYAKRSHRIIPVDTCYIQNPKNDEIIEKVKEYILKNNVKPYDEEKHKGLIRHIVTRYSKSKNIFQVTIVINGNKIPNEKDLIEKLTSINEIESIVLNINLEKTNVILGNESTVIYGDKYITDKIGDIEYRISPTSFYQVNPIQTEKLYKTALEFAGLTGDEVVWDAYCGIGTISLFLAQKAKWVYGVEIVEEAIKDADFNKELNGIDNVEFFVGKAEEVIEEKYKEGIVADVIVVDPPRKGCDQVLLNTILKMHPERVVYVSCDPGTLARDLRVLADGGYEVRKVQPVDMFGMSGHIECVIGMQRKDT